MKQFYLLLLLVTLPPIYGTAQIPQSLITPAEKSGFSDDYEGSIYQNVIFKKSNLVDENSTSYDTKLRYNIYNDKLEFKKDDVVYQVTTDNAIHATIGSELYYYCEFLNNREMLTKGYFILVDQTDAYSIYKKYNLKITEPTVDKNAFGTVKPGKIKQNVSYYMESRKKIFEIPTNKKEFLALFNDKKEELKDFMSSRKLKLKKEEHLASLMSKYQELVVNNGERLHTVLAAKGN